MKFPRAETEEIVTPRLVWLAQLAGTLQQSGPFWREEEYRDLLRSELPEVWTGLGTLCLDSFRLRLDAEDELAGFVAQVALEIETGSPLPTAAELEAALQRGLSQRSGAGTEVKLDGSPEWESSKSGSGPTDLSLSGVGAGPLGAAAASNDLALAGLVPAGTRLAPLSSAADLDRLSLEQLRRRWAQTDLQLMPYTGEPDHPAAQQLIAEQIAINQALHRKKLDDGSPHGIGLPGGPRDVVVVGGGPAGLQAAIMAGADGLDTLLIDGASKPGGQAGMSSRLENFIGFEAGVSGAELTTHGLQQAQRVGAEIEMGVRVMRLEEDPASGLKTLHLSDGRQIQTRSVVIAGGLQFRRNLPTEGINTPGVVFGDSSQLRQEAQGQPVVIVGGGNSAGQAVIDAAQECREVTLVVRGESVREKMSAYLVEQLYCHPRVRVLEQAELEQVQAGANGRVTSVTLKSGLEIDCVAVGVFIGSAPQTDWTGVERNERGQILVGGEGRESIETSISGVYAAGDVRQGAIGRAVAAAADGAHAVHLVHRFLARSITRERPQADAS